MTTFLEWPGKPGGTITLAAGEEGELNAKTDDAAELKWFRGENEIGVAADAGAPGEDAQYIRSADGRTLTIANVEKEKDEGPWAVVANDGQPAEQRQEFQIKVKDAVANGNGGPNGGPGEGQEPPSEWDPAWALKVGIGALLLAVAAGCGIAAAIYYITRAPETWHLDRVPVVVTVVLLGAGSLALVLAAALAAIEVRGRARARPAAILAAKEAGARGGAVIAPILKEMPEIVKAFGGLKEAAALAVISLALFGGAVGLAWAKFPDVGESAVEVPEIEIAVADQPGSATGCRVTVLVDGKATRVVKAGDVEIEFNDTSKLCGATLDGAGLSVASGWRHIGKTTTSAKLKPIVYKLTILKAKEGTTPTPKRTAAGTLTATT